MEEQQLALPCNHSIEDCWHPHYHFSPFNQESAQDFRRCYLEKYLETPSQIVPLCMFAGATYSPYAPCVATRGTFSVCSKCNHVMKCGYSDKFGLGPRNCEACSSPLNMNDYFQPVFRAPRQKFVLGHKQDPAIAIAEVCALSSKGVPRKRLTAIICILTSEGLMQSRFIDDFVIDGNRVVSRSIALRLSNELDCEWIDVTPFGFNVKLTALGNVMLKAKKISPSEKAKERIKSLLAMGLGDLQDLARIVYKVHSRV